MSDRNPPTNPDDESTTVSRWPLFGRGKASPPPAPAEVDETTTQWVPAADRTTVETPYPASPPPPDGGWFSADDTTSPGSEASPGTPEPGNAPQPESGEQSGPDAAEPRWATWDDPWEGPDEPFDQTTLPETGQPPAVSPAPDAAGPVGSSAAGPGGRPAWAPADSSAPSAGWTSTTSPTSTPTPTSVPTSAVSAATEPTGARGASWANLHAIRLVAQVACPLLLLIGLSVAEDGQDAGWSRYTAWAFFAMACALLQLATLAGRSLGLTTENAWFLAAVGTAGLVGYWVIIVLPGASSNTGFAQTLAVGLAVVGLWLSPGRRV